MTTIAPENGTIHGRDTTPGSDTSQIRYGFPYVYVFLGVRGCVYDDDLPRDLSLRVSANGRSSVVLVASDERDRLGARETWTGKGRKNSLTGTGQGWVEEYQNGVLESVVLSVIGDFVSVSRPPGPLLCKEYGKRGRSFPKL